MRCARWLPATRGLSSLDGSRTPNWSASMQMRLQSPLSHCVKITATWHVEAFRSGKPVVTCSDSGEVAVLVEHERTGLVVSPDPASLGAAFERLHSDRGLVATLGAAAAARERTISWDNVVPELAKALGITPGDGDGLSVLPIVSPARIRVAVIDMQPITPAVGGGRLRLLGLYHALGPDFETTYVGTYDWPGERRRELRLSDSLTEIDVPLSAEHFRRDAQWRDFAGGATIIDTTFPILGRLSQDFLNRARSVVAGADAVVFSHPWVHPLLIDVLDRSRQLVVYDSHNVEALLRYDILGDSPFGREIAKGVAMTESFLARDADLVVGCSAEDLSFYNEACGVPHNRMCVVPNGVFVKSIMAPSPGERAHAKAALGIEGPAVMFIGSNFGPNIEAAEFIARSVAPALPDVTFLVCGGVADASSIRSQTTK